MKVIINRGVPGSGKSTGASKLEGTKLIYSADDFFMKDGEYHFDPKKIGEAHVWNQKRFLRFVFTATGNPDYLVVDNTNTQLWEMAFYIGVARCFEVEIEIHEYFAPAEVCAKRNVHGVPAEAIARMLDRWEKVPPFWGIPVKKFSSV